MGSSDTAPNKLISSMELDHETTPYTNLKIHSPPATGKNDLQHENASSSSPDSPLEDYPFRDNGSADGSSSSSESSPKNKNGKIRPFRNSVQKPKPLHHASNTEVPPIQVMENPTSSYRIPSSVFAKSKSKAGMEWSVASNDSLFSLHTGNMSFTNNCYSFRLSEVGVPEQAFMSGGGKVGETRSHELGVAEATMKEVIMESEDQNHEKSMGEGCLSHRSDRSNISSTQSFAFPIFARDLQNGDSIRMGSPVSIGPQRKQSKPKLCTEPESQPPTCTEPKRSSVTGNTAPSNRWSCFPCGSFF